jgi:hypothetical protein
MTKKFTGSILLILAMKISILAQQPQPDEAAIAAIREIMKDDFKQSLLICATSISYLTTQPTYEAETRELITQTTDPNIKSNMQQVTQKTNF